MILPRREVVTKQWCNFSYVISGQNVQSVKIRHRQLFDVDRQPSQPGISKKTVSMHTFISGTVNLFNNISQVPPILPCFEKGEEYVHQIKRKRSNEMFYNSTQVKFIDPHFPVSSQSQRALTRYFGAC